jgi:hypothetical protein
VLGGHLLPDSNVVGAQKWRKSRFIAASILAARELIFHYLLSVVLGGGGMLEILREVSFPHTYIAERHQRRRFALFITKTGFRVLISKSVTDRDITSADPHKFLLVLQSQSVYRREILLMLTVSQSVSKGHAQTVFSQRVVRYGRWDILQLESFLNLDILHNINISRVCIQKR